MRAWGLGRVLIGVACAGIVFAGTASSADAKPGYHVISPSVSLEFAVKGSNGYKIEVTGAGKQVEIWVGRPGGGLAKYRVPGRGRRGVIKANLGALGRIDLRFDAKSVESDSPEPEECRGKPSIHEEGTFEGTMRFRGEGGYTRFSATRVPGWVSRSFRRVCKTPDWLLPDPDDQAEDPDDGTEREIKVLGAAKSSRHRTTSLQFISIVVPKRPGQRRLSLVGANAKVHEQRGRIDIERSGLVLTGESALIFGPTIATATLTLPAPFTGSATYDAGTGGSPTWSGSLQAHLPGADPVPLTGAGFVTALCQGTMLESITRCLRPVEVEVARGPS